MSEPEALATIDSALAVFREGVVLSANITPDVIDFTMRGPDGRVYRVEVKG